MTALTEDRNTPQALTATQAYGVAAATIIYGGALVVLGATGFAAGGTTATGLVAVGRAEVRADNAGGADADINVEVEPGIFRFANSAAADEITAAGIGDDCYIVDDQTVAKTDGSSTRSVAGKITQVDARGVWVQVGIS